MDTRYCILNKISTWRWTCPAWRSGGACTRSVSTVPGRGPASVARRSRTSPDSQQVGQQINKHNSVLNSQHNQQTQQTQPCIVPQYCCNRQVSPIYYNQVNQLPRGLRGRKRTTPLTKATAIYTRHISYQVNTSTYILYILYILYIAQNVAEGKRHH